MSHMIPPDYVVIVENSYRRQELFREAAQRSLARQADETRQPLMISQLVGHILTVITSAFTNRHAAAQPNSAAIKATTQELSVTSH
jgi:hypothetical protein